MIPILSIWWLTLLGSAMASQDSPDFATRRRQAHRHLSSGSSSSSVCSSAASVIQAQVLIGVLGRPSTITQTDLATLEAAFLETYNTQSSGTCNDVAGFRNATQVTMTMQTYTNIEGNFTQEFTLIADVVGICNGCDPNSQRLFEPNNRRLDEGEEAEYDEEEETEQRQLNNGYGSVNGNKWKYTTISGGTQSPTSSGRSSSHGNSGNSHGNSGNNNNSNNSYSENSGGYGNRPSQGSTSPQPARPSWSQRSRAPRWGRHSSSTAAPTVSPTTIPQFSPISLSSSHSFSSSSYFESGGSPSAPSTPSTLAPSTLAPSTLAPTTLAPTTLAPSPSPSSPPTRTKTPTSPPTMTKYPTGSPTRTKYPTAAPTAFTPAPTVNGTAAFTSRLGCSCPGVLQSKFAEYLNATIQNQVSGIDAIESVSELQQQCDASVPLTNFSTTIAIAFETGRMTPATVKAEIGTLQDAFQLMYNEDNTLNALQCDSKRHYVTSVTMETDFSLGRRRLRRLGATDAYSGIQYSVFFAVVNGTCRGCTSNANIFAPSIAPALRDRALTGSNSTTCSCPYGAWVSPPSLDAFIVRFGDMVSTLIDSNALTIVGQVADVMPVKPVQCATAQDSLNGTLQVQVETTSALSAQDLSKLSLLFTNTFNELARRTCDPYFTNLVDAQVIHVATVPGFRRRGLLTISTTLSTLIIVTRGRCRGCKSSVALFNDGIKSTKITTKASNTTRTKVTKVVKKNTTNITKVALRRREAVVSTFHQQADQQSSYLDPFHNPFRSLQWFDDGSSGTDDHINSNQYLGHQFSHNSGFNGFFSKDPNIDVCFCDRDAVDSTPPTLTDFQTFFNTSLLLQNLTCIGEAGVIAISIVA